jgi:hypothetical protein
MAGFLDGVLNSLNRFHQWTKDTQLPGGGTIHDQPGVHEGISNAINAVKAAQARQGEMENTVQRQFDNIPGSDCMQRMGFRLPPTGGDVA